MNKTAAYHLLLSQHPLWQKTAFAPSSLLPAGGAAIGGALGGIGGYLSTDDKEKRKKRAVIGAITGGALGGVGGEAVRRFSMPSEPPFKPPFDLPPPDPTRNNIPLRTKFLHDAIDKHREDYLRYELGLLGVKNRLTPDEVRGLLGGMDALDSAPVLNLLREGAPRWRAGEVERLSGEYKGLNIPAGGSLIDARLSRAARDDARVEAKRRVDEFLANRPKSP